MGDKVAELEARRAELELGGGKERIERQHAIGQTGGAGTRGAAGGQRQL